MDDAGYAWIDIRCIKPGWKEVFRLRLTGWIPQDWAEEGLRNCVVVAKGGSSPFELDLTITGKNLTDPDWGKYSPETFHAIFQNLLFIGFDEAWLIPPRDAAHYVIRRGDMFSREFVESVLSNRAHLRGQ
ncbi:hypothetical protein [Limimaricola cinnabarinus]|uniref:hypothetical protein n=1 Tax=Limimaricola cinnabarinus TaxID=1125964 RepID=UPI00103DB8B2|nr:hypothetical protein [Limimaricola cinnabarinus]